MKQSEFNILAKGAKSITIDRKMSRGGRNIYTLDLYTSNDSVFFKNTSTEHELQVLSNINCDCKYTFNY